MAKEKFDGFKWVNWSVEHPRGVYSPWKQAFIELSELPSLITKHSQEGHGFLRGIWQYHTPKQSEYKIADLIFDFDSSNSPEIAQKEAYAFLEEFCFEFSIPPEQIEIFFSGSKGFGARVPYQLFLKEVIPSAHHIYSCFVAPYKKKYPSIDMALYTRVRLWRIPNTIHPKTNLWRIHLTLDELNSLTLDEIKNLAKQPRYVYDYTQTYKLNKELYSSLKYAREKYKRIMRFQQDYETERVIEFPRTKADFVLPNDPRDILEVLRHNPKYAYIVDGVPEKDNDPHGKGRNYALCKLIGATHRMKCSKHLIEEVALTFNDRCSPPKDRKEILKVVDYYIH